jgi:hypothetical protein
MKILICELIVHLLAVAQNNKKLHGTYIKVTETQQAKITTTRTPS